MIELLVICALIMYNVFMTLFFMRSIQELMNKLMSRNYVEYQQGQAIAKDSVEPARSQEPIDPLELEDLRSIGM